jgi:long-chain acyl-CoA synthetase
MTEKDLYENLRSPIENFYHWEKLNPNKAFLKQPYSKEWKTITYAEAGAEARKMLAALRKLGLQKGDHIGILSKNCYHWILADLAIMMGGFVSVPFYASLQGEQLDVVVNDSEIKLLFVGKLEQWSEETHQIPENVKIIKFPHYKGNAKINKGLSWDNLIAENEADNNVLIPNIDDLWTILYTSGTTGKPKGVMHSYKNPALVIRGEELAHYVGIFKVPNQKYLSFLPLNHVGERIGTEINCLATGGTMSFGESLESFVKNLQDTQATFFFAVPRIWTKFYEGVTSKMNKNVLNILFAIPFVSSFIKKKIKFGLGLADAKIVATGAAITPAFLKEWYKKLDIHLIEAYGMTEVCGAISYGVDLNTPYDSVGKPVPFCEIKLDPETQEILMKTPYMMLGYFKSPEKTAEVLKDGWLHSGDRGFIDQNGYVKVIGRINDAFKTSKGKFVIPNPIEQKFEKNEFVENICLCGYSIPQPIALVTLNENAKNTSKEDIKKAFETSLNIINKKTASYEKVAKVVILPQPWTEQNGLLTPTLKVKRPVVDDTFGKDFEKWYEEKGNVIWA